MGCDFRLFSFNNPTGTFHEVIAKGFYQSLYSKALTEPLSFLSPI